MGIATAKRFTKIVLVFVARIVICIGLTLVFLSIYPGWMGLLGGDGFASADTWLDTNRNGQRDSNELPLAEVCVWGNVPFFQTSSEERLSSICEHSLTDWRGHWPESGKSYLEFRAGANCNDILIFAKPPDGYESTTALVVNDCHAVFGFVPSSTARTSATEYISIYEGYVRTANRKETLKRAVNIAVILVELLLAVGISVKSVRLRERDSAQILECHQH
jgi:hypothetical protein